MACFQLDLNKKLALTQHMLSISINQQGERLSTQHNVDGDKYIPSIFCIVLIKPGTSGQPGKIIKCHTNEDRSFQASLILSHAHASSIGDLEAGRYLVLVIAKWNQVAMNNPDFKQISVKVQSQLVTSLKVGHIEPALLALDTIVT